MDDTKEKDDRPTPNRVSTDKNNDQQTTASVSTLTDQNVDIVIPPLPSPHKKKRARNELTMKIKEALLDEYEQTPKPRLMALAEKYKIGRSTVSEIIQRKDEYRKLFQNGGEGKVKRLPGKTKYTELNNLIYEWYLQESKKSDEPITWYVVKDRALKLAEEMDLQDFKASEGWLSHWRQRYLVNKLYVLTEGAPNGNVESDSELMNDVGDQSSGVDEQENKDDGETNNDSEKDQGNHGNSVAVMDQGTNTPRCSGRKRKQKTFRDYVSLTEKYEQTPPPAKKARKELTLEEKCLLISDYEQFNASQRELANRYSIGRTTVYDILRRKELYKNLCENKLLSGDVRRLSYGGKYVNLNQTLYEWFCLQEKCNYKQIREKAKQLADEMNLTEFKVSNGWFDSWKQRYVVNQFNLSFEAYNAFNVGKLKKEVCVNETEETFDQPYIDESSSSYSEDIASIEPIVQIETVDSILPLPVRASKDSETSTTSGKKPLADIVQMKLECEEFQANGADDPTQSSQESGDQSGLLQYMKFCDKKTTQKLESSIQSDLTTAEIELENILLKINESDSNVQQLKEVRNEKSKIIQQKLQEVYELQSQLYELDGKQEQASTENKILKRQLHDVREKVHSCNQALIELKNI